MEDVLGAARALYAQPGLLCLGFATTGCLALYNPLSQFVAKADGTLLRQARSPPHLPRICLAASLQPRRELSP